MSQQENLRHRPASGPRQVARSTASTTATGGVVTQRKPASTGDGGLPDPLRAGIETLSGQDMSDVSVHYNSSRPARLGAFAFAQGTSIHLGPGQAQHLPHEAWHVVQQKQGRVPVTGSLGETAVNTDTALEREADVMGAKSLQLKAAGTFPATVTPLQIRVLQGHWWDPMTVAKKDFDAFSQETTKKSTAVKGFADDVYEAWPKTNDVTKSGLIAKGLAEWSKSAVNAARSYYAEFDAAKEASGGLWQNVYFGISDFTDPDFTIEDQWGTSSAHEVKRVTAKPQGSVDKHLRDANRQLRSRTADELNADVYIANSENPWPYTPKGIPRKLPSVYDMISTAKKRNIGASKPTGWQYHKIKVTWLQSNPMSDNWHFPKNYTLEFEV